MKKFALIISLLFIMSAALAQAVSAGLDRTEINQNETVQLTISLNDYNPPSDPDLQRLTKDFDVLSTIKSKQLSIFNSKSNQQTQWQITLAPRQTGVLTIPALQVGAVQTEPLKLKVTQAKAAAIASNRLFLEVEANPKEGYVQSQILYIVRLFVAENMQGGSLTEPVAANAIVIRLGNDSNYQTQRHGRTYQVVERHYAIFPQSSGELIIASPIFMGQILKTNRLDPFVTQGQPVRLSADKISLQIKPKPPAKGDWLPAQDITLAQSWAPANPRWQVGEPVTRIITLNAIGLSGEQLPDLSKLTADGFNIYPGQPQTVTTANDKSALGQRVVKLTYIPTQAGNLAIPAVQLTWWNLQNQREQQAFLPAQTVSVAASATTPTTSAAITPPLVKAAAPRNYWPWLIAGIVSLAWIITLAAWWQQRHQPATLQKTSRIDPVSQVKAAALDNQPEQTKDALLQWAAVVWPAKTCRNLADIILLVQSSALKAALKTLDSLLYSGQAQSWDGSVFWQIFAKASQEKHQDKAAKANVLPPLYPE